MGVREDLFPVGVGEMDSSANHWLGRVVVGSGGGLLGGYSHESEHDLAAMVSDFLENGSSGSAESWHSSDNDSSFSDLTRLADRISLYKHAEDQYESDLLSVVCSLILSMDGRSYQFHKPDACKARCLRFSLAKLLHSSGYDAAICTTKWQGSCRIPGGEHEFIDVINQCKEGFFERYIVDIDFRSQFEIARAVRSYSAVLNALPVVYVGAMTKLTKFLEMMEQAARSSLKQNAMPLPPWRSLAYLEAKWESPSQRIVNFQEETIKNTSNSTHKHCTALLWRLKSCIRSEFRAEGFLLPTKNDMKRRPEVRKQSRYSFSTP